MAPTVSPQPPPPPQPPAAPAKKSSPWKWILIGCAGVVVLGCILAAACGLFVFNRAKNFVEEASANPAKAAAEMAVRLNPDLELVSTDDAAETITIRDKKTGKTSTVDWSAIEDGKLTFESDGETYTLDGSDAAEGRIAVQNESGEETMSFGAGAGDVPDWFPAYHNAQATNVLVNANQNGQQSTIWTFTTTDAVADVLSFYETQLEGSGWEVTTSASDAGGTSNGSLEGKRDGGAKTVNLVITKSGSDAGQAMVTYTGTGG
jgi:hypothetical protein